MENPKAPSMADRIKAQQQEHQDQFDIATSAAIQRGFSRWFDDTWMSAKANGALPNPFISSIFVFITTVLMKKFVGGFASDMPLDHKERAIADAKQMMIGYLDQIEAAAVKDMYAPKVSDDSRVAPATKREKQTIILPNKRVLM